MNGTRQPYDPDNEVAHLCAYCGVVRATTSDHVIPRTMLGKHKSSRRTKKPCTCRRHDLPAELLQTVPACLACNLLKGTRRLVPPSWADKVDALNGWLPGTPWRVWTGDPLEPAFRNVHR